MNRPIGAVVLALLLALPASAIAQDSEETTILPYSLGDQTFSIHAGVLLPLFFHFLEPVADGRRVAPGFGHLTLGGTGGLEWGTYLDNGMRIGIELGGSFAFSKLSRSLVMVPVTGSICYEIRFYPFEIGLHGAAGLSFTRLGNDLYIGPILKPRVSAHWNYNAEWAFGLRLDYWWVPEFYVGEAAGDLPGQSGFGNFLSVTFSTLHHF